MTDEQSAIFRRVIDTNWEIKELGESGKWLEVGIKLKEYNDAVDEMKASMGEEEYANFIRIGKRMFAPLSVAEDN